jgi:hypothetical protein
MNFTLGDLLDYLVNCGTIIIRDESAIDEDLMDLGLTLDSELPDNEEVNSL